MNTKIALAAVAAVLLSACVSAPETRSVPSAPPAPVEPPPPPVSPTKVYFYPQQGQSEAQQDRDRYECYNWAVKQTGFDPALHFESGEQRATVVPARSSSETVGAGAVTGAVIGAIAGSPHNSAQGALIGAIAGAALGSAAADADQTKATRIERYYNSRGVARYEREAAEYRRAMSACLEGRGYSVK
jgi:hypothetical protein